MKPKTPFQYFLITLSLAFIVGILIQTICHTINMFSAEKLFKEFGNALNLSLLLTLIFTINTLKKTISPEGFKIERKRVIFNFFIIILIVTGFWALLKPMLFGGEVKWDKIMLYSLVMAIVQTGLSIFFSEYLLYKSKNKIKGGDNIL